MAIFKVKSIYMLLLLLSCIVLYLMLISTMKSLCEVNQTAVVSVLLRYYEHPKNEEITKRDITQQLTSQEEFQKRVRKIQKFCSSESHLKDLPGEVRQVLTNEKLELIYCVIPKSGCTFWKRLFTLLNEKNSNYTYKDMFSIPRHLVHKPGSNKLTFNSTLHDRQKYPLRLLVARDPFSRLLSSYLDKLYLPDFWHDTGIKYMGMFQEKLKLIEISVNTSLGKYQYFTDDSLLRSNLASLDFVENHFQDIHQRFHRSLTKDVASCGKYVTFSEFILAAMFDEEPHWMTSYQLCDPCQFKPTHVMNMETFTEDARAVLAELGLDHFISHLDLDTQVNEEMSMLVDYHFNQVFNSDLRHFYHNCITPLELAYRLWQTFIWKGYLHPNETYHVPDTGTAEVVKSDLLDQIDRARRSSVLGNNLLEDSRRQFAGLFRSTLSEGAYQQVISKFRIDLEMFDFKNS